MKKFLLLIHGEDRVVELTPTESHAVVAKYRAWSQHLREENRLIDSEGLKHDRRWLSNGGVSNSPADQSTESIGGYFIFTAQDLDEATEITKQCPALAHGGKVELCAVMDY
ncbi:hypothetical protein BH11ARM1_BH11ARM1_04890 [soil metagenome]